MPRSHTVRGRPDPTSAMTAVAADAAQLLLDLDPLLGEHACQVAVDAFVEQAARALQALAHHPEP